MELFPHILSLGMNNMIQVRYVDPPVQKERKFTLDEARKSVAEIQAERNVKRAITSKNTATFMD